MTISTTVRSVDIPGNGTTTAFTIGFPWQQDADLTVTLINNTTLAETPWTLGVDYTLTGGDPTGTLTATVAPASGETLHVERELDYHQSLDLIANDGFDAEAVEDTLDRIVMMIQQLADSDGGGSSGSVTIANIGTGEGVSAGLVGSQYQLKSLKASGTGLAVADDADSITYTLAGVLLAANDLSDVDDRQTALDNLTDVASATDEHVLTKDTATGNAIWKVVPTGGSGEANTSSNAGGTVGLALAKAGVNLPFRGLTAGTNVTLTAGASDVTIAATGEANTISATGASGTSPVQTTAKSGVDLRLRGVLAGTGISLSSSATDLTYSINLAAALAWTGAHSFTRSATTNSPNVGVASNNNGAMSSVGVVLASGYLAAADIRKTTNAATEPSAANNPGGIHALYVQHQVSGVAGADARLFGGVRSAIESSSTGVGTELTAFYGAARNTGNNANAAWGFFADLYHDTTHAGAVSRGVGIEVIRRKSSGIVTAYEANSMNASTSAADMAFGVLRQSVSAPGFGIGFGIGNALQSGHVGVGFDTFYASIGTAAIRLATGHLVRLNGASDDGDMWHNSASTLWGGSDAAVEFLSGGSPTFGIRTADGVLAITNATGTTVGTAGGAAALPATPLRYLPAFINIGGTMTAVKIPCYTY